MKTPKFTKKIQNAIDEFLDNNGLVLISADTVLKGNRVEITVASPLNKDKDGKLKPITVVLGYGKQEVEVKRYVYTVIRNDNDYGTDGISLFHFCTIAEAREWVKQDINRSLAALNITDEDINEKGDSWVYDNDTTLIDWSIRRLPLQDNSTWTDPNFPVKYRVNEGE